MPSFQRSHHHQGPSVYDFDVRFENRNSEDVHNEALAATLAERQRINSVAVRAIQLENARLEQMRLQQELVQEEERVRLEEERVREEIRLREIENRARQIPKVPARVPTPPPSTQTRVQDPKPAVPLITQSKAATTIAQLQPPVPQPPVPQPATTPANHFQTIPPTQSATTQPSNSFAQSPKPPSKPFVPASKPAEALQAAATTTPPQVSSSQSQSHLLAGVDRYVEIHKKLKELRKYVNDAGNKNKDFKKAAGELRRTLRMAIGQCVSDKSKNKGPANKIFEALQKSIHSVPSPGVDPSMFMLSKPGPQEGALNNGEQMPMLFIFLLNFFAKYVVSQFLNEAGVNPELADPIGVVVAQVFSKHEFLWRGESMIDILMAKIRVTCPVLFGVRGNESTEDGRARLGWIRDDSGAFISEQSHGTRMVGIAAGYAALCLRDFSKSKMKNPWHPTHYWQTMASIVSTPSAQRSTTQYIVLRSMIDGYEAPFLKFYGNAALAALAVALVKFPSEARAKDSAVPPGSSAVGGVEVLADKLKRDRGIRLTA